MAILSDFVPVLVLAFLAVAVLHLLIPLDSLLELRSADPALATALLVELRLPRTLLAAGYGAVLGMTGAALQATFANPLASPDITGSSSGAALGAVTDRDMSRSVSRSVRKYSPAWSKR